MHVEVAMAAEIEENRPLVALFLGAQGLRDGRGDGVVGLRRGNDSLRAGKLNSGGKRIQLLHGCGFGQA